MKVQVLKYYVSLTLKLKANVGFGYYIGIFPASPETTFRTMDLDRPIFGKAYIGRIKDVDNFGGNDLFYGIVYKGRNERVDYTLFKSMFCT